jgi:hypothetical protein
MRKEYFKPVVKSMEFETVGMLAASAPRYEYRGLERDNSDDAGSADQWGNLWN